MSLRDLFLLDPNIHFLNHGSFGATPIPVFEAYQNWQLELERQPVEFLGRRFDTLMNDARAELAQYVGAEYEGLVFVPNATIGLNTVARSLDLQPGDEILATNHEYGAMDYMWQFVAEHTGASYVRTVIPLPIQSKEEIVETLWEAVTPQTKVIFFSHISSGTAITFPVAEICQRAKEAGILTVIDGAHAPGQRNLNLVELGVDFYSGNCHKWMCAPKGAGFLYVAPEHRNRILPLVISWGWLPDSDFVTQNQWQGTKDVAAYLSVPHAIRFLEEINWCDLRDRYHQMALQTRKKISELVGIPPITPDSQEFFQVMFSAMLPENEPKELHDRLYDQYRVEVPVIDYGHRGMIRVSLHAYTSEADTDALLSALKDIFHN